VDEAGDDRGDGFVGDPAGEFGPPPVAPERLVQACPRGLEAPLGADVAGDAADRLEAEVQQDFRGRPLGPSFLA
jgi:hypothetical protein